MAGDRISASVGYYYQATGASTNPNIVTGLLASLSSLITNGGASAGTLTHGAAANITNNLNTTPAFVNSVEPDNYTSGTPQAYLTILFFDERFNFISAADGGVYQLQVRSTDAGNVNALPLIMTSEKAPKNGYAYIYLSNRSDQDVFFDNLNINVTTGNIIEENHYYAYGLKIAGISSVKLPDAAEGSIKNTYLYNDKEFFDDGGLNWYDYGFRSYDPQIGRFMQLDPLTDDYPELTPYQYAGDDPIANVDIDGLLSGTAIADAAKPFNEVQTLAGVVVYMKPAVTAGSVTRSFFSGLLSSALGTVKGIVHVIAHPLNTAAALGNVALHPIQTIKALKNIAVNTYRAFKAGDANVKSKMIGHAAGDILQLLIGTGEAKAGTEIAEDVGTLSKVVKETEEGEEAAQFTEVSESLAKNGETNATKLGKEAHKAYHPEGYDTERKLTKLIDDEGKEYYPDALDRENKIIRELKPNNARKIREGERQAQNYKKILENQTDEKWRTVIDTYDIKPDGSIHYNYGTP